MDLAIYGRAAFAQLKKIDLKPGLQLNDMVLHFGDTYELIQFQITDAQTGAPVSTARISIHLREDEEAMVSATVPGEGKYLLCLPHRELLVGIVAPGYSKWVRQFSGTGSGLSGIRGVPKPLTVRLHSDDRYK